MIVCVDIDHTLTHAAWRDEHIAPAIASGKWDHYHSLAKDDKPSAPIVELVSSLMKAGHDIYILTARPRKWKRQTYAWLHKNGILIDPDKLLMRPDDNFDSSADLKLGLAEGLNVDLVIDDRDDVTQAFLGTGVTTLQVRNVT